MIELALEQVQALAEAGTPPTVMEPTTKHVYVHMAAPPCLAAAGGNAFSEVGGPLKEPDEFLETPVELWKHLVARKHPARKQLYIKRRNMTVRQLLSNVIPNRFTKEEEAADLDLPVEAIREVLAYAKGNAL
jgi:hypothetical protein